LDERIRLVIEQIAHILRRSSPRITRGKKRSGRKRDSAVP
jgi:hypothetical protein